MSWVVVWLCWGGEDSDAVPDADWIHKGSFLLSKSHFCFWIRVRGLNKTDSEQCCFHWKTILIIIWKHTETKMLKTHWTKLNIRGCYPLIHITQLKLLHCCTADLSGYRQGTPEGVLDWIWLDPLGLEGFCCCPCLCLNGELDWDLGTLDARSKKEDTWAIEKYSTGAWSRVKKTMKNEKKLTRTPQISNIQISQGTRDIKYFCHVPLRGCTWPAIRLRWLVHVKQECYS